MYFLSLIVRCKDEPFVLEFINHYLREGIDFIYLIDDNSSLLYEKEVLTHSKVKIFFEENIIENNTVEEIYQDIKNETEWLIYVDIDEFITTRKNINSTIRNELINYFSDTDCIKVPWVMMSANGRKKNPKTLLSETIWRWNHDLKHINTKSKEHKFRCRYDAIEIKSIFRPAKFEHIWDHHPKDSVSRISCVESVHKQESLLSPFYDNLREKDIENAYLLCYHFRIISEENSLDKIKNNIWYNNYTINDLMSTDYAECIDRTLKDKNKGFEF